MAERLAVNQKVLVRLQPISLRGPLNVGYLEDIPTFVFLSALYFPQ